MIRYLSYRLSSSNPAYGHLGAKLKADALKSFKKNDPCQVYRISFENHWGTHIDCPAHFFADGKRIAQYPAQSWLFRNPQVVNVSLHPGQLLRRKYLEKIIINAQADILLLRSGWSRHRKKDYYSLNNPGIHPETALFLRREYPNLRAIGIDWISVSSFRHRPLGRKAHKAFLNPRGRGNPILIIEDMRLPENINTLEYVWALPLLVVGIDSSPCTVVGVSS